MLLLLLISSSGQNLVRSLILNRFYFYSTKQFNYGNSSGTCERFGLNLLDIRSLRENEFIFNMSKIMNDNIWIGGKFENNVFTRLNTTRNFTQWDNHEPLQIEGCPNCAELNDCGAWQTTCCTNKRKFICSINSTKTKCTEDHCYFYHPDPVSCEEAREVCETHLGGNLVAPEDDEENGFLVENFVEEHDSEIWIRSPPKHQHFQHWSYSLGEVYKNCPYMNMCGGWKELLTSDKDSKRPFVCKVKILNAVKHCKYINAPALETIKKWKINN